MTDNKKKLEPLDIMEYAQNHSVSQTDTKTQISKIPINVLFDPEGIKKKDVWEIDLVQILSLLLFTFSGGQSISPRFLAASFQ